ncbi:MAG: class I SAM-dependent rRNA methyltransferase [Myxococcales bacterium]|nr:class I SAM-dependent rRNA methyltransferase [Myxococcales bacterium]MCB9530204.1 class I SAM-dependent rRNA methyltransferase [Myxococcales bacterium]MCB9533717.1 class I SAM-dependent rRNA methyltransferase [Myxococcales bacterium]
MRSHATVTLAPRAARPLWHGHPWVRDDAIARVEGSPRSGDVVRVVDERGAVIDYALWGERSRIRARTLGVGADWPAGWETSLLPAAFWDARLAEAVRRRAAAGLPSAATTAYRLLNSEGDHTPGVIVDVFGGVAAVQLTTAAAVRHADAIASAVSALSGVSGVVLQVDARQAESEGFDERTSLSLGVVPDVVEIVEANVTYLVQPLGLQKTGHYCDQRENRALFGGLARGRRCLDAHAYTGGFALHAALGGAASVVAVDSSRPALDRAAENTAKNGCADRVELRRAKVEDALADSAERGERFDLISLDPPKLAASRRDLERAMRKVEALCAQALRVLAPEGILMIASCSHAIGPDDLKAALGAAAGREHRPLSVLATTEQPPDHPYPVAMREGRYLSAVTVSA